MCSAAMPMPLSVTFTCTRSPRRSAARRTGCPGALYLQALLIRLENTCARRTASASSHTGSGGSATVSSCPRRYGSEVSSACDTTEASSTRSRRSSSLPLVMRADVEQVVDQASHQPQLPPDHRARLARPLVHRPAQVEQPDRARDRRERVAQLVRQRRQELVLALRALAQLGIRLLQRRLRALAVRDIAEVDPHPAVRQRARADLQPRAVVRVVVLHALRRARRLHALVHQVHGIAHRVRKRLVPRLPQHVRALAPQQALGRRIHVRHAPARVVGDEPLHQAFEVIDGLVHRSNSIAMKLCSPFAHQRSLSARESFLSANSARKAWPFVATRALLRIRTGRFSRVNIAPPPLKCALKRVSTSLAMPV